MNTSGNIYASRKRKKPQTSVKPTQPEGVKSNPSKRHRERLNGELERLANLLPFPQDVISKLDKLTVLRLCVSYLRAKSFFNVTLKSTNNYRPESNGLNKLGPQLKEGELLLQVLNGFILVVTAGGTIFYVSSTIQDYLGFNQSDIIHQSAYDLIHTEDRAEFQRQLHWALDLTFPTDSRQLVAAAEESPLTYYNPEDLPPENSAFLERNFVCRVRCLLDNSSGFITLNFKGYLKFLHGQNERTKDGAPIPPQLALFTVAAPLQPPAILEIQTTNVIFRTRHKLDFTPTDCDAKGRIVLGYTEVELCERGSGYQFIHAADMHYCAENHIRLMKMGESGMTVFRLLTKNRSWVWVQAKAHLIYKNGLPDCIIASQRVLTDEEGEENLRKRDLEFPFCFTTGEAMLYDLFPNTLGKDSTSDSSAIGTNNNNQRSTNSMLGSLLRQDESIYGCVCSESKPQEDPEGQPEEDCGGIFSSRWQSCPVPSLSESSLFKQEPQGSTPEENIDGELWSLMRTLGITREDFELFQHDEMFLNMDFGGTGSDLSVTDEILSYVEQSLSNKLDWVFSCSTRLGNQGPSFTALEQQNHLSAEPSSTAPRWQQEQLQLLRFHPQSGNHYPPPVQSPHAQHHLQKQKSMPCQDLQIPQQSVHGQVLPNQQLSQHRGSICSQPVPQQQQCCHRLTLMQVNRSGQLQSQYAFNSIQETPPLFQSDQPGQLVHSHPQHKHLCLGEPTLNNHLNTLSVSSPPELSSYVPPGPQSQGVWDISPQDPEELLNSWDSGQDVKQDGGQEPWWGVEARSRYQLHLTDRQLPSLVLPQYSLPKKLSLVTHAEQPFITQNGILQETTPLSSREADCGPSEQAKHQAPAESWPYLDLSLMGFM